MPSPRGSVDLCWIDKAVTPIDGNVTAPGYGAMTLSVGCLP